MGKKSPCLSCKRKNVYEPLTKCFVCNFSGIECKNFEMYEPMYDLNALTNADRIRAMSDEELAKIMTDDFCELLCGSPISCDGDCNKKMLRWLKQEVDK